MLHKHFCGIKFVCYLSLSILFFLLSDRAHAIKTFEESSGRFIIDLPDGWELQSQTDKNVFVFKGDGKSIIMEYVPNSNDRAKLFTKGVGTLQSSGLPNASPKEEIKDLTVNSNPARWGLYNDKMKYGSIEVELYAVVGSVLLREGGVYFLSILSEDSMKSLRGSLEKSFQSIRFTGQPVTGASKAEAAAVESLTGSPTTFEHKYLTLMLPPGWSTQEIPANFEKETIAWLKSDTIAGASVNVFCYRGLLHKKSSTRIRGLKSITATYPKGQKLIKDKSKLRTDSGGKAEVELWQGILDVDGQAFLMQSPMGVLKTKHCWLLMIGYVSDSGGSKLEDDFLKIIKSAK